MVTHPQGDDTSGLGERLVLSCETTVSYDVGEKGLYFTVSSDKT